MVSSDMTYRFVIYIVITYLLFTNMSTYCREYLDIIDLTGEREGSADSDSEIDDLPLAPITMSQPQRTNDRWVVITGVTHCLSWCHRL